MENFHIFTIKLPFLVFAFFIFNTENISAEASFLNSSSIANNNTTTIRLHLSGKKIIRKNKKFRKRNKRKGEGRANDFWVLISLGFLSIIGLIITGATSGISILSLSGFIFFTLASGLSYILSNNKKKKFALAIFLIAIFANVLSIAFINYYSGLF